MPEVPDRELDYQNAVAQVSHLDLVVDHLQMPDVLDVMQVKLEAGRKACAVFLRMLSQIAEQAQKMLLSPLLPRKGQLQRRESSH